MSVEANRRKLALIITVLVLVGCLGYYAALSLSRLGETKIILVVNPRDALVTVGEQPVRPGAVYLSEGDHVIQAQRKGFKTTRRNINVASGKSQTINLILPIESEATSDSYYQAHPEESTERENIAGQEFQKTSDKLGQKYPFINQLPILTRGFTIYQAQALRSKVKDGDVAMALEVTALTPIDRQNAVERIRTELGIDPSTIEIRFINQANVFADNGGSNE